MEILRGLIEAIILHPAGEGLEIELIGEIAKMLELPGVPGSSVPAMYRSSVKVVAGARYQRYLQLAEGWVTNPIDLANRAPAR
jgi:hypothetical protein